MPFLLHRTPLFTFCCRRSLVNPVFHPWICEEDMLALERKWQWRY
ncbi:hypothetical protein CIPAW_04G022900 [Carya illinoinensis]|uniref:Uncharacterized protein n=1 Tax=Carya illinoinensis TaxID=32201 RepID=A0A8T1QQQ9_CARIL|nr:hypothetical protein CIPAW_04G022900 [Carya illinoinensis]